MNTILMILTSHSEMLDTDAKTGVWLGEFTEPYYHFTDAGFNVVLASPKGGRPPVDEMSSLTEHITGSNRRFQDDEQAQKLFNNTITLENLNAEDYIGIFFPGGHGPMWDLAEDESCGKLIADFHSENKIIGAVCHGSAAFSAAAKLQPDFLQNKRITCFSNQEEVLTGKIKNIPYLLEDLLSELGANIENGKIPFAANVTTADNIVTGQNPLSAGPTAKMMIELLNSR